MDKEKSTITEKQIEDPTTALWLTKIQELKEDQFTKNVLLPILESIGYIDIDFNGGPYEEGKDFICWKNDELGDLSLTVGQSKKLNPKESKTNSLIFRESVSQLREATRKKVPNKNGEKYLPQTVYFVTPYAISTRSVCSVFDDVSGLEKVKIIDGRKLYLLAKNHNPSLIDEIVGIDDSIASLSKKKLWNKELMNALKLNRDVDISHYYTHLDFLVGTTTSSIFFDLRNDAKNNIIAVSDSEWLPLKRAIKYIENHFNSQFTEPDTDSISRKYEEDLKEYNSKNNQKKLRDLVNLRQRISSQIGDIESKRQHVSSGYQVAIEKKQKINAEKLAEIRNAISIKIQENQPHLYDTKNLRDQITLAEQVIRNTSSREVDATENRRDPKRPYITSANLCIDMLVKLAALYDDYKELRESTRLAPTIHFKILSEEIASSIDSAKYKIKKDAEKINSGKATATFIRSFLSRIYSDIKAVDTIRKNRILSESAGFTSKQTHIKQEQCVRFTITLHDIFESNRNIAIFGDAGAGKTTTLQKYSHDFAKGANKDEVCLYIPLNRVGVIIHEAQISDDNYNKLKHHERLLNGISRFLRNDIPTMTTDRLTDTIRKPKRCTVILDGIDEGIKNVPWLVDAINSFAEEYKNIQLIVSSRINIDYGEKINFLGISLLPFTLEQQTDFINGWFKDDKEIRETIINHTLATGLHEIVRSPLLLTMLCVQAEHGAPFPSSEISLYQQRIKLFTGFYDSAKGINRLTTDSEVLFEVSRKIAYQLHEREKREDSLSNILENLEDAFVGKYSKDAIKGAVSELINPCNILCHATHDGKLGFGHLRFQEHLVAEEISRNRSIDIVAITDSPWWRGSLVLYAKIIDDFSFLIDEIYSRLGFIGGSMATLMEMAKAQGPMRQRHILELIHNLDTQDKFDSAIDDMYIDDDDPIDSVLGRDWSRLSRSDY